LPEVVCNTSPLQYLHQVGHLAVLPALARHVIVPPAVIAELAAGRAAGVDLPNPESLPWLTVRAPRGSTVLRLVTDLGRGETEVLALALESGNAIVILDDFVARRVAHALQVQMTGTLGVLLDAKRAGLLAAVTPVVDALQRIGFRLSAPTRAAVLHLAGEGQ
jgi:predicted nucleic acid-binding protein